MTVTVTMLQTRRGEDGNPWTAGNSYNASDAFAQFLIASNLATGTLPQVPQSGLSPSDTVALKGLVSTPGNQPSATLAATVGTAGKVVRLSDGPDAGALLVWAIPQGASAYSWCWWLWPQSAY